CTNNFVVNGIETGGSPYAYHINEKKTTSGGGTDNNHTYMYGNCTTRNNKNVSYTYTVPMYQSNLGDNCNCDRSSRLSRLRTAITNDCNANGKQRILDECNASCNQTGTVEVSAIANALLPQIRAEADNYARTYAKDAFITDNNVSLNDFNQKATRAFNAGYTRIYDPNKIME
ncbi:MAG: hypothetical protein LBU68_02400, partial [Rickettsiales bacterium]|nr:hypothetical protein [Rickettsiales bacterium]